MAELEKFLEERSNNYPIPEGPVEQVTLLAKELVLGVHKGFWVATLYIRQSDTIGGEFVPIEKELRQYLQHRWGDIHIGQWKRLLRGHGYLDDIISTNGKPFTRLSRQAFALLSEAPPYNVFISYRRLDSSAFALLVLSRLKEHNLVPFVDMATKIGEKWYDELHEQIKACDYLIILLGRNTLKSEMTIQEIKWAIEYRRDQEKEKKIIPIWHSKFNIGHKRWQDVDQVIKDEISETNAIRVLDESASGYNTAIVELLNRFGITP